MGDDLGRDSSSTGPYESVGSRLVRYDCAQGYGEVARCTIDNGLQVAAASGDKDNHWERYLVQVRTTRGSRLSLQCTAPMTALVSPLRCRLSIALCALVGGTHTTRPIPQLNVR